MTDEAESDEADRRDYAAGTARIAAGNARLCVAVAVFLLLLATLTPLIAGSTWGLILLFACGLGAVVFAYVGGVESERAGR